MTSEHANQAVRSRIVMAVLISASVYLGGYFILRWQHFLIRTTSCYASFEDNSLYADSEIRDGLWWGDENYELKCGISRMTNAIYRPLGVFEAKVRNSFFSKVNIER